MRYPFPVASHIDAYLAAIAGRDEFIVKRDADNGLLTINYLFTTADTFPDPLRCDNPQQARNAALRRDCRGIEFDSESGDVVSKKYHKFFGVNQTAESQMQAIAWSEPHRILEKLDGSMITPYRTRQGGWQWHSKMGATAVAQPVNQFVAGSALGYGGFCEAMAEDAKTPIFEWCSRQQRIVVDYPEDGLILTAIRDKASGQYTGYAAMQSLAKQHDVPCVRTLPGDCASDIAGFLAEAQDIAGAEGYVIRFDDGHNYKIKGRWYLQIHHVKAMLASEKYVWAILLDNRLDDVLAFMDPLDRAASLAFEQAFTQAVRRTVDRLARHVAQGWAETSGEKKRFVLDYLPRHKFAPADVSLLLAIWGGKEPIMVLHEFLRKNIGSQSRIDAVRHLLGGLAWREYYRSEQRDE